jgi:hypothetical protein
LSSHTQKATVFVTLSLVLMLLVAQNNVFKGIPILTGAKAIKHKTSSHTPPSPSEGNIIQSSSQPNIASPGGLHQLQSIYKNNYCQLQFSQTYRYK